MANAVLTAAFSSMRYLTFVAQRMFWGEISSTCTNIMDSYTKSKLKSGNVANLYLKSTFQSKIQNEILKRSDLRGLCDHGISEIPKVCVMKQKVAFPISPRVQYAGTRNCSFYEVPLFADEVGAFYIFKPGHLISQSRAIILQHLHMTLND